MSRPFAHELASRLTEVALSGGSGIASCERGKHRRLICLLDGRVATVASNVIEEQLVETLVRRGELDAGGRAAVADAARASGIGVGAYLARHDAVPAERLTEAAAEHARTLVQDTLGWSDGSLTFAAGRPDLKGEPEAALDPVELLVDAARRVDSLDAVRGRIGPETRPATVERADALAARLPDEPVVAYLLERADGTKEASTLIGGSPADAETTWRALYALMLTGAIEPRKPGRGDQAALDAKVTRTELLARLERAESSDYYAVLEINGHATPDQIREAYYFLARRFHPDRFRSGPLADLLPRIDSYFAKVTEASNTLSDAELRSAYDERRAATRGDERQDQDTAYLAKQNYLHAKTLIQRGRFTDAATALENALKLDESEPTYHYELGALLAANPRYRTDAERHLLRASELDPSLLEVYLALGTLYEKAGRPEEAARSYRELLRWEPGHLEAGERLAAMGQPTSVEGERGLLRGLFKG